MTIDNNKVILEAYQKFFDMVVRYIEYRIQDATEAYDIAQDAYLRMLEYQGPIHPDSVKSMLFCIAGNLIVDYFRRHNLFNKVVLPEYFYFFEKSDASLESQITADQISALERKRVASMSERRRIIYSLSRYSYKKSDEIAGMLMLSKRTVESHLYQSRIEIRNYIKRCI